LFIWNLSTSAILCIKKWKPINALRTSVWSRNLFAGGCDVIFRFSWRRVWRRAFWYISSCNLVDVDRRFKGAYCPHHQDDHSSRTSETSVYFNDTTWRYIPEGCHLRLWCWLNLTGLG
jgi:hypothetical protein